MDEVLTAIAGALAKQAVAGGAKALGKLVQFVKEKFAHNPGSEIVLASAQKDPDDRKMVDLLAQVLDKTEETDPSFGAELRTLWAAAAKEIVSSEVRQTASGGGVNNNITGNVSGFVVQARDITGGIHNQR
jgi:hypothetical protein